MNIKRLTKQEIKDIIYKIENLLKMYSPQVTFSQASSESRVIMSEEQDGKINEWDNIVCDISIKSTKGNFEKTMNFHPALSPDNIAQKIVRKFFDKVNVVV